MQVDTLGTGEPELAVVGGIHGDEPCGVRAVERLREQAPDVDVPVKLVVANEPALEHGVRYVDADLNRSFPGDPDSDVLEERIAATLVDELADCTVLALHSTRSHADSFALVATVDDLARRIVPRLSVVALVETGPLVQGRIFTSLGTVEVECGLQGSEAAAENAVQIAREFLVAAGALPGDPVARELPVFRIEREIPKPSGRDHAVHVANFEEVAAGQAFAAVDGAERTADAAFYPVLLSADGYESVFGYAAEKVGRLPG